MAKKKKATVETPVLEKAEGLPTGSVDNLFRFEYPKAENMHTALELLREMLGASAAAAASGSGAYEYFAKLWQVILEVGSEPCKVYWINTNKTQETLTRMSLESRAAFVKTLGQPDTLLIEIRDVELGSTFVEVRLMMPLNSALFSDN